MKKRVFYIKEAIFLKMHTILFIFFHGQNDEVASIAIYRFDFSFDYKI